MDNLSAMTDESQMPDAWAALYESGLAISIVDGVGDGGSAAARGLEDRYRLRTLDLDAMAHGSAKAEMAALESALARLAGHGPVVLHNYVCNGCLDRIDRLLKMPGWLDELFVAWRLFGLIDGPRGAVPCVRRLWLSLKTAFGRVAADASATIAAAAPAVLLIADDAPAVCKWRALAGAVKARVPATIARREQSPQARWREFVYDVEPTARRILRAKHARAVSNISDIYGTRSILSQYCGLAPESVRVPGYWMHGWIPAYHNVHPAFIALHKSASNFLRHPWARDKFDTADVQLVLRQDQAEFLRANGYERVAAIGHPRVYLENPRMQRISGSLLVMPPHGGNERSADDPLVKRYVESIVAAAPNFSVVRLCIGVDDFLRKNWWTAFERAGIRPIVSVDRSDPHSTHRLTQILSQFEYVTTNGFGSCVAYGAMAGCKVSVYGPYAELPRELLAKAHAVVHFPELLEQQIDLCTEARFREHYPELFVEPDRAVERVEWACRELGCDKRLSPAVMAEVLRRGWPALETASSLVQHGRN